MSSSEQIQTFFDTIFDAVQHLEDGEESIAESNFSFIRDKLLRDNSELLEAIEDIDAIITAIDILEDSMKGLQAPQQVRQLLEYARQEREKLTRIQREYDSVRHRIVGQSALQGEVELIASESAEPVPVIFDNDTILLSDGTEHSLTEVQVAYIHYIQSGGWSREALVEHVMDELSLGRGQALSEYRKLKAVLGAALTIERIDGVSELRLEKF